jgi:hypothetical protein
MSTHGLTGVDGLLLIEVILVPEIIIHGGMDGL